MVTPSAAVGGVMGIAVLGLVKNKCADNGGGDSMCVMPVNQSGTGLAN